MNISTIGPSTEPAPQRWQDRLIRLYSPLRQRWALVDGQRPTPTQLSEPAVETQDVGRQPEATVRPLRREVTV